MTTEAPPTPPPTSRVAHLLDRPLTSYYLVLGSAGLLLVLGLVMVFSASSVTSFAVSGSSLTVVQKQAIWVAVGVPLVWITSRLSVTWWRRLAYPGLFITIGLLALVLVPGIGVEVNGNTNWIEFGGPFRLQPSEAAKLALVLFGADLLARKTKLLGLWRHLLIPLAPVSAVVIGLVLAGGDLGTALILMAIVGGLYFFAGAPFRLFGLLGASVITLVVLMSISAPHRMSRFTTWLNPDADYLGDGWQAVHSKFALASGGWWGLGLGASREKWGTLPEAHTDFIYAVIGEELGLMGTLVVLILVAALIYGGIRIALRCHDPFVRLAAAGATTWLAVQSLINIGAVVGVLPITGVPLPLVSYGGSALLPTLAALGMLLSFARCEPGAAEALTRRRLR